MDFEIVSTKGNVFIYSNLTNHFTKNGEIVDLSHLKNLWISPSKEIVTPFDEQDYSSLKKGKQIKTLKLFLGYNCNYNCGYCIQKQEQLKSPAPKKEDVDALLTKFDDLGFEIGARTTIQLWGGEPFVYLKTLQYLIPKLRAKYPNTAIWTISNGSLMNQHILDMLVENRIYLTFSHDGQGYFVRGEDPLKDPDKQAIWRKTVETYKENELRFSINAVISQYNSDLFALQDYLIEKLSPNFKLSFEGVVVAHTKTSVEFTQFPKKAREQLEYSIQRAFFEEPESLVTAALLQRIQLFLGMVSNQADAMTIYGRCNAIKGNSLTVDFKGNVLSCHNASSTRQYVGTLDDYENICMDKFTHWSRRPKCPDCLVLDLCRGNCIRDTAESHISGCPVQEMFHTMLFKTAFTLMTGETIKQIKAI